MGSFLVEKDHVTCAVLDSEEEARLALSDLSIVLFFTVYEVFFGDEPWPARVMLEDIVAENVSLHAVGPVVDLEPTSVVQVVRLKRFVDQSTKVVSFYIKEGYQWQLKADVWLLLIELVVQVHVGKKDCDGLSLDTELLEIIFESQPASLSRVLLNGCSVNPLVHL